MKKIKRIIALLGVILLFALYISTIVLACIGSEEALNLLKTAIYATIVLPILLWAYSFIYKLLKNHYSLHDEEKESETGNDTPENDN